MLDINWSQLSKITFSEKIYFILRKWNQTEVDKFSELVYNHLERLTKNPEIGIFDSKFNCFSIVISKQTTLHYRILESEKKIELVYFGTTNKIPNN